MEQQLIALAVQNTPSLPKAYDLMFTTEVNPFVVHVLRRFRVKPDPFDRASKSALAREALKEQELLDVSRPWL